jgi:hypothetical protein
MRRYRAPSTALGTFFVVQFSADCTTNMSGFDLRQAQSFFDQHSHALHGGISTLLHFDHEQGVFINLIGVLRRQDAAIDQCRDQRRKQRRRNQFGRRHGFEGLGLASSGTRGLAVAE